MIIVVVVNVIIVKIPKIQIFKKQDTLTHRPALYSSKIGFLHYVTP